jgi:hypothetical protein
MTPYQHFRVLTDELTEHTPQANCTPKGRQLLKLLRTCTDGLLHPTPISDKQRVTKVCQQDARKAEQRVIENSPILNVPCLTNAPPVMLTCNPTAKRIPKTMPRLKSNS